MPVCVLSLSLSPTHTILAQEVATLEVGGGYAFLHDSKNEAYPVGWFTSAQWNVAKWFSVGAEGGANYYREEDSLLPAKTVFGALLAGPRVTLRQGRFAPFAHVLAGSVHFGATVIGTHESLTRPAIDLGGAGWM